MLMLSLTLVTVSLDTSLFGSSTGMAATVSWSVLVGNLAGRAISISEFMYTGSARSLFYTEKMDFTQYLAIISSSCYCKNFAALGFEPLHHRGHRQSPLKWQSYILNTFCR